MAPIPGWAFLGAGAVVVGFSKFVEARSGSNLILFVVIGCAFVVIGIAKIAYQWYASKTKPKLTKQQMQQRQMQRQQPLPQMWQGQRRQGENHHRQHPQQTPHQNSSMRQPSHHIQVTHEEKPADHTGMNTIIACPNCSVKHYSYAKFCMMCGYKIR